jgi:hypothetical protein
MRIFVPFFPSHFLLQPTHSEIRRRLLHSAHDPTDDSYSIVPGLVARGYEKCDYCAHSSTIYRCYTQACRHGDPAEVNPDKDAQEDKARSFVMNFSIS